MTLEQRPERTTGASLSQPDPLSFWVKLLYGIGEIPITVSMIVFGLFILFFYNSVMGVSATVVGIASAVGLLWDAVIDPYIGYRSDHSKSRLGRRHAYMLAGSLTMGFFFWLLLAPPQGLGPFGLFLWLLVATLLLRLTSAIYRIPYLSLGAELSQDYHERTSIVGIRSFFGLCGTLAAASLSFVLFFPNTTEIDPKLNYSSYPKMGLAYGAVMMLAGLLAVAGTTAFRFRHPASREEGTGSLRGFVAGFLEALRNPAFRAVWLSFSLFFLAVAFNSVLAIHYFTWYVHIDASTSLSKIQSCFFIGALVGVVSWIWLSKRTEKRKIYLLTILMTGALMMGATLLFGEGHLFGTGNPVPLYFGNALAGFFASGLWVVPGSMLADIADADELKTGQRREGVYFGLLNFGEKIAAGLAVLLGGLLLDYFVLLVPGEAQSAVTTSRIGLLFGFLPALLLGVSAALILGYRLDHKEVTSIQSQLKRHAD
ncbi:MAG: MFS transporter [Acidobacteriota bacterium]